MALGPTALITVAELPTYLGEAACSGVADATFEALISAATAHLERATGTHFVARQWTEQHSGGPGYARGGSRSLSLDRGPLTAVVSIVDGRGNTVDGADYTVYGPEAQLVHRTQWPAPSDTWAMTVSGGYYADTAAVDGDLKRAAALLVQGSLGGGGAGGAGGAEVQSVKVGDLQIAYQSQTASPSTNGELPPTVASLVSRFIRNGV
jgi:uncharacterized phiE125 gp8 family phage protein